MADGSPHEEAPRQDLQAHACVWRYDADLRRLELGGAVASLLLGLDEADEDLLGALVHAVLPADRRVLDAALRQAAPHRHVALRLRAEESGAASVWRGAWDARGRSLGGVAVAEVPAGREEGGRDPLTGLLDRAAFLDSLRARLATGGGVRLLVADVQRFGRLNAALGVDCADLVLAALGGRLAQAYGGEAAAARLGDDEFALLLPPGPDDGAVRLRAALERPLRIAGCDIHPALTVGSVAAEAGVRTDASELLRRAGLAIGAAREGPARSAGYEAERDVHDLPGLALAADARAALGRGEIEAFFQPVVTLATGRIAGFEALARWRHPRLGVTAPDDFLPLLAEAGQLGALGRRMLADAVRALRDWRRDGREDLFVSVNLTCDELERPGLVAEVAALIAEAGLPAGALKLELTEGEVMRDPDAAAAVMHALRAAGAGLAVDDFGMGFSSLSYLTRLPLDVLKIDRYFVRAMATGSQAAAVIRSVTALAADLGLDVVAEGVETAAAAGALRALGCRYGQGFGYAPPLPAADALALLASGRNLRL